MTDATLLKSRGETILLFEDDPAVRDSTANLLETLGYMVLATEDGTSALEAISNAERVDLLISDIALPGGMIGVESYEQIRRRWPELKCLFMSGNPSLSGHQLPEGTELLHKPIDMNGFGSKIRQAIDA